MGVVATVAVLMAKGYTFSSKQGGLVGSGIISVASIPDGASVYIDGHLTTATNTNISGLSPKKYQLKIVKEGFIPWEKEVTVGEGVVSEVKATLFPALPTIYPLTYNGVLSPVLSPNGEKLAFAVPLISDSPTRQKGGIWVWTMTSQPIALARSGEPHQIVAATTDLDFSKGTLRFSPDSTQVLVSLGAKGTAVERNYLLPADRQISLGELRDITPTLAGTLQEWATDQKAKDDLRILAIKNPETRRIASCSTSLT
ncbi:MAG: PEGA domain-containing protein, partial [Dehalococcoidia bacterium]|nr:PEGA domain-containing protein [Dehalococcoidia bacterium]